MHKLFSVSQKHASPIILVHDSAADVSAVSSKLSSMTEERDLLKASLSTTGNKLSSMTEERDLLKANLSSTGNKLSSMTEERDLLQANLAEKANELERLQSLSKQSEYVYFLLKLLVCVCKS